MPVPSEKTNTSDELGYEKKEIRTKRGNNSNGKRTANEERKNEERKTSNNRNGKRGTKKKRNAKTRKTQTNRDVLEKRPVNKRMNARMPQVLR